MGAFLIASVSMFVSCKDYDDDISKNAADITALQSQLNELKSSLTSQLNTAQSELANKANAADVTALAAKVTALETQIKAIDDCASKKDLDELKATVAALTGEVAAKATQDDIAKAVEAQNKIQADALDAFKKEVEAKGYLTGDALTQLTSDVADLKDKLSKIDVNAAIDDLKKQSQETLDELTKKVNEEIATMKLFVTGKLTSVVLKPDFYWEGIEGVEVPMLHTPIFKPVGKYSFSYYVDPTYYATTKGDQQVTVTVDEVMAAPLAAKIGSTEFIVLETSDGKEVVNKSNECSSNITGDKKYYLWKYWDILKNTFDGDHYYSIKVADLDAEAAKINKDKKYGALTYVDIMENPIINYHINPSTANIEGAKIEFYENDAQVYTRNGSDRISPAAVVGTYTKAGEDATDPHHTNIYNKATGVLSIPFACNWDEVNYMFNKWANFNNTGAQTEDGWLVEPGWGEDTGWKATNDYNRQDAYGTSDFTKKEQGWDGQNIAPLPLIAVELTTADTLVTSDYAVVVPAKIQIVALADNAPETRINGRNTEFTKDHDWANGRIRRNHLYESVGYTNQAAADAANKSEWSSGSYGAIPMPATHSVAYNGSIDLKPFVETHYSYTTYTRYGQSNKDQVMSAEMLKALGLHYEFKAIDYIKGANVTGESKHIEEIEEGVFAPRSVTENGETITGQTATREAIDREPLIRVDLVDSNNNIVRYGYIKLRIVDVVEDYDPVTITFDDKYMNCGTELKVTWSQVENLILAKLNEGKGLTKKEFEQNFYFDNERGYTTMPTNANGSLEDGTAANNRFWGRRFYNAGTEEKPDFKQAQYRGLLADGSERRVTEALAFGVAGVFTEESAKAWNDANGTAYAEGDYIPAANTSGSWMTNVNNWFGRVWYTPHDNATNPQAWDEQTNVLVWDLLPEYEGNMNKLRYQALMKIVGVDESNADYKFDGASTKDLKTTIRFVNRLTDKSLYVTLVIPAGKLHFNYGEVGNKDWSHWFKFNGSYWNGGYHNGIEGASTSDAPFWEEFDTHVNPHKPSNVNYVYLDPTSLTQRLTDFWLDPANMVIMKGGDNFSMFKADAGNAKKSEGKSATALNDPTGKVLPITNAGPDITFIFTYPVIGLNSEGEGAEAVTKNIPAYKVNNVTIYGEQKNVKVWEVKGATATWLLTLRDHNDITKAGNTAIVAVGKNGASYPAEEVAYLDGGTVGKATNPIIKYHGLEVKGKPAAKDGAYKDIYPAATDLINRSGAYDAQGNERFTRGGGLAGIATAEYLEKNIDETFTAYIKLNVSHDCYDPIVAKQYFNVRIYRPINVAGLEVEWYDRVLADNTLDIKDLVEVVDWNDFAVVSFGSAAVKERNTVFGIERPKFADVYNNATSMKATNAGIPFEYYGISELAVRYDEIRTDHAEEVGVRNSVYYDEESIVKHTKLVKGLPSLSSDREAPAGYKTLTLLNADTNNPDGSLIVPFDKDHAYAHSDMNTSGNGTKFGKIYYNNDAGTVQLFHIYVPIAVKYNWGNIAWDDILNDQPGKKLDNDYTQKVWAVITVNATHKK